METLSCFMCLHTKLLHSNHFEVNTAVSAQTKPYYSEMVKIIYIKLFQQHMCKQYLYSLDLVYISSLKDFIVYCLVYKGYLL